MQENNLENSAETSIQSTEIVDQSSDKLKFTSCSAIELIKHKPFS